MLATRRPAPPSRRPCVRPPLTTRVRAEQAEVAACRPRAELTGADAAAWAATAAAVATALATDESEADTLLARAHGWTASPYLRGSLTDAVPDPAAVSAALAVLTDDLGLDVADAAAVVRAFPETLSRDADARLRANLGVLAKQWKMGAAAQAAAVKRAPRILGYTIDCAGDCAGECDRCWVRF